MSARAAENYVKAEMQKLEQISDTVAGNEHVVKLVEYMSLMGEHWQIATSSTSFITLQIPTIVDAIEDCGKIVDDCTSIATGDLLHAAMNLFRKKDVDGELHAITQVYQERKKLLHAIISVERWIENVVQVITIANDSELYDEHDITISPSKNKREKKSIWKRLKSPPQRFYKKKMKENESESKHSEAIALSESDNTEVTPTVTIEDEIAAHCSRLEEEVESLVPEGEDMGRFFLKSVDEIAAFTTVVETLRGSWKPALRANAHIQSIIPLVHKAFGEIMVIANMIKNAIGVAFLNPISMVNFINDVKKHREGSKTVDLVYEAIDDILASTAALKSFVYSVISGIHKCRALHTAYKTLKERA